LKDVIKRETVVGATGPGSRTLTYPKALNELLGTKFKIVSGYPGRQRDHPRPGTW
jgi:hypothetical protein